MEEFNMTEKPWRYSHTQLALWKLCKRRYYNKYVLGKPEPKTPNMAAGTWLCQNPIEDWERNHKEKNIFWESVWANFLAEFGGDASFADKLFTLKLAKQILAAYKANPVAGKVVEIERTFEHDFGEGFTHPEHHCGKSDYWGVCGHDDDPQPNRVLYTSRPDFVTENSYTNGNAFTGEKEIFFKHTWDIKLKTFNQRYDGDTFYAEAPLSPFDDQCLGQAVCAEAQAFGQIQFFLGKKDGVLIGPVYVEQPVSPVLAEEWKDETYMEMLDIDTWQADTGPVKIPWPKNDQACHAFGKACTYLKNCNFGFERAPLDKGNENC